MAAKPIYRVVVHQQGEVWDLYAREIFQSELWGFIESRSLSLTMRREWWWIQERKNCSEPLRV